jgi:hypothetical protein
MLARTHLALVSLFCMLLIFSASLPAAAQIHGVPPSVTSFGFGGSNNPTPGVPASVTSLGPFGFDCCSGPFIAPFRIKEFDGHHFQNHHRFPVGEMTPAVIPYFVPYPVPYEDYTGDDHNGEMDSTYSRVAPAVYEPGPWYREAPAPRYTPAEAPSAHKEALPPAAPERAIEVAPQPATVLVYKDGHTMEVENYAILGDTLFYFAGSLSHKVQLADLDLPTTRKTNDDRGIDFHIPGEKTSAR